MAAKKFTWADWLSAFSIGAMSTNLLLLMGGSLPFDAGQSFAILLFFSAIYLLQLITNLQQKPQPQDEGGKF